MEFGTGKCFSFLNRYSFLFYCKVQEIHGIYHFFWKIYTQWILFFFYFLSIQIRIWMKPFKITDGFYFWATSKSWFSSDLLTLMRTCEIIFPSFFPVSSTYVFFFSHSAREIRWEDQSSFCSFFRWVVKYLRTYVLTIQDRLFYSFPGYVWSNLMF